MIDYNALFKISYGLYIVSSGDAKKGNAFISNTVFQVTSSPAQFAACVNKNNYTCEFIENTSHFAVSVLHEETDASIYGRFGYKSGRDFNKMEGMNIHYGETGVPIILNDSIAFLEFKVVKTVDVGSHLMFIGELVQAEILDDDKDPITYLYYRRVKKGVSPKNAPTYIDKEKLEKKESAADNRRYQCSVCGYIYENSEHDIPFDEQPDTYKCPVCGADKDAFVEL